MRNLDHFRFVATPHEPTERVARSARILADEIASRTGRNLAVVDSPPSGAAGFVLGTTNNPGHLHGLWSDSELDLGTEAKDAYRIRTTGSGDRETVGILGNSARAVLFGVGRVLRQMHMTKSSWTGPDTISADAVPDYSLIGHQLGYRDKTNSYCAWDETQFRRYILDLALFGTNAIEVIPPRTDDLDNSPHFPIPHLDMLGVQSRICDELDMDVWIWFPVMQADYTDEAQIEGECEFWDEVLASMPRLNHVFVPGGDPGHTRAPVLMDLLERLSKVVAKHHEGVGIWISPQGFDHEDMPYFLNYLEERSPDWVGGVVHGPWVNIPMGQFREMVPDRYPIRNYPDITHTLSAQFPVPDWDVAFATTIGREPVNPRPVDEEHCFRISQPGTTGMLTYSEGCNDDVNKFIWSSLSWGDQQDVFQTLVEYSRMYIDPDMAHDFAHGLLALERNWRGPLAVNRGVQTTLRQFQAMEKAASPFLLRNWRFQQALYRAYYDAYVHQRLLYETGLETEALDALGEATVQGSRAAIREAFHIWDRAVTSPIAKNLRTRVFQLAEALFQSIRMQLSVPMYGAQYETRGANLDAIDYPLNDRVWWRARLSEVISLKTEEERLAALDGLLSRLDATPGGFHDDLVRPHDLSRVQDCRPYAEDPGALRTPSRRFPYRKDSQLLPISWRGGLVMLGTSPLRMRYENLEPGADYELRIAYAGISRTYVRLDTEEGVEIHDYMPTTQTPDLQRFDVPAAAVVDGTLNLIWRPHEGVSSSGVVCDMSEIVLCKKSWLNSD